MHPKTLPSFWSDLDFEQYEGQELANARATWSWIITGPDTNKAGIFLLSKKFTSDVGLPLDWLRRVIKDFPRAFALDEPSRQCLARNYIRIQFSVGDKLSNNVNMCKSIISDLRGSAPALAREVFRRYPEIARAGEQKAGRFVPVLSPSEALAQPLPGVAGPNHDFSPENTGRNPVPHGTTSASLPSPCQALAKGPAESVSESESPAQGGAGGKAFQPPTLAEVLAAAPFEGLTDAQARAFFDNYQSNGWFIDELAGKRVHDFRARMRVWRTRSATMVFAGQKRGPSGRLDSLPETPADLRAALQTEKNPHRRAALEEKLRHGGPA